MYRKKGGVTIEVAQRNGISYNAYTQIRPITPTLKVGIIITAAAPIDYKKKEMGGKPPRCYSWLT